MPCSDDVHQLLLDEDIALSAIFDEDTYRPSADLLSGQLLVFLEGSGRRVDLKITPEGTEATPSSSHTTSPHAQVTHLPAISLHYTLPRNYPECAESPTCVLRCVWLTEAQLSRLSSLLVSSFTPGSPVLFDWHSTLQEAAAAMLDGMGYELDLVSLVPSDPLSPLCHKMQSSDAEQPTTSACLTRSLSVHGVCIRLLRQLIEHDATATRLTFNKQMHDCEVCFSTLRGDLCTYFEPCRHTFCSECATAYFESQVAEGQVHALGCMAVECDSVASQFQVRSLVSPECYTRYERLQLGRALDTMEDTSECPSCKTVLFGQMLDAEGVPTREPIPCPNCQFVFCARCKQTYHGVVPCKVRREDRALLAELARALSNQSADSESSADALDALKERLGQRTVELLLAEEAGDAWVEENAKKCPVCGAAVQKFTGCNKMTCAKCGKYFCWLCLKVLDGSPYKHFQNANSPCFAQLFRENDDFDELANEFYQGENV